MKEKGIDYKQLNKLIDEVNKGLEDDTRKIEDISNIKVRKVYKKIVEDNDQLIESCFTRMLSFSAAATLSTGALSYATAAGIGAISGGSGMAVSMASGAAAGSVIPGPGTLIGAGIGAIVGLVAGKIISDRMLDKDYAKFVTKLEELHNNVCRLEAENKSLRESGKSLKECNDRYKYLLSSYIISQGIIQNFADGSN